MKKYKHIITTAINRPKEKEMHANKDTHKNIQSIPIIAASTKRLSRLHTIILTPRGVGRNLWRGPPRGGWGGIGGGGTFRWYARIQRPTLP